jgi:Cellulase (glycosyl hydrolase family 5)
VDIKVSPDTAIIAAGGSFQFSSNIDGGSSTKVVWKVNGKTGGDATTGTITDTGTYTGPVTSFADQQIQITAYSPDYDIQDTSVVTVLGAHEIGVQSTSSYAVLAKRSTGQAFVPRGNNYMRLATLTDTNGNSLLGHSTFNVGLYNATQADAALSQMQADGYNAVRISLQGCCANTLGDPAGGLSSGYLDNVVDFLKKAQTHHQYVLIMSSWLPAQGGYTGNCAQAAIFWDANEYHLCAGTVAAAAKFWQDFVNGLIARQAPLQTILAYELDNEYYYNNEAGPLTQDAGMVTAANGQAYDMGSTTSRQQMMDDGLVYFTNTLRKAIQTLDPTALVTVGFFVPQGPNPTRPGDSRVIEVYPAMASSDADFVDLHAYPIPGDLTLDQIVQNFGFVGYQQQKPVVMGEFGGFKSEYAAAGDAASGLSGWQTQSCAYHFGGWMLWTWDTDEQTELWNAKSSNGAIEQKLAPTVKADPCAP